MSNDMEEALQKNREETVTPLPIGPEHLDEQFRKGFKAGAHYQHEKILQAVRLEISQEEYPIPEASQSNTGWVHIGDSPQEFKCLYNLIGGRWIIEEEHEPYFEVCRIRWDKKKENWFADGDCLTPTKATHAMLPPSPPKSKGI